MKRFVALLLTLIMVLSLCPTAVWAEEQLFGLGYILDSNVSLDGNLPTPSVPSIIIPPGGSSGPSGQARWGRSMYGEEPYSWVNGTIATAIDAARSYSGTIYIQLLSDVDTPIPISFTNGKSVILDLNGYTIDRGLQSAVSNGSVITVDGVLTICDTSKDASGKITGGCKNGSGGGVYVDGTFTLKSGTILGNAAANGGGVYIAEYGSFIMEGGSITGNRAVYDAEYEDSGELYSKQGGGVYLGSCTSFIMRGGAISENTATSSGGGVAKDTLSNFIMNGGIISKNSASNGGGVYITDLFYEEDDYFTTGSFTLNAGTISENTANSKGGGVFGDEDSCFYMNGGTISGNTATAGGGIYCAVESYSPFGTHTTFTMCGGTISGNTATNDGGGMVSTKNFTMEVSGAPVIRNNIVGTKENNVSIFDFCITVGDLSDGANIGVTVPSDSAFTIGGAEYANSGYFVSDDPDYVAGAYDNNLKLYEKVTISFDANGGNGTMSDQFVPKDVQTKLNVPTFALPGYVVYRWNTSADGTGTSYQTDGSIKLSEDTRLYAQWHTIQARWGLATGTNNDQPPAIWVDSGMLYNAMTYANSLASGTAYIQLLCDVDTTGELWFQSGKTTILDLNGKTINRVTETALINGSVIGVRGTLTLCDTSASAATAPGKISGGYIATRGGGVHVYGGTFTMNGGSISENRGSGVYISGGTFTMNGGAISENSDSGVYVSDGTFTMNGGTISENRASGVYIYSNHYAGEDDKKAIFIMNDGIISENTASAGGGVCANYYSESRYGVFHMAGGAITGNTASQGGGVYGPFTMSGGTISGNTAQEYGGGVYLEGNFKISGAPVVINNEQVTASGKINSNVYRARYGSIKAGALTDGTGIGLSDWAHSDSIIIEDGAEYANSGYFISDDERYEIVAFGNDLKWVKAAPAKWGLATGENSDQAPVTWVDDGTLTEALSYANNLASGTAYIRLFQDVDTTAPLVFDEGKTTILDLNGNTIDRGLEYTPLYGGGYTYDLNGNVVTVKGNLTICDSSASGDGKVTGGSFDDGGGVYIESGVFTLESGSISGNAAACGGGVYNYGGSFVMNGGAISENIAHWDGGGVFGGKFTMNGGTISKNTAKNARYGGGGVNVLGTFTMNGGSISENTAPEYGGGVYVDIGAKFTMNDGFISGNTAAYGGGVILRGRDATFTMRGGTISGNNATDPTNSNSCRGGGVYIYYGTFEMSGGEIKGNNYDRGSGGGSGGGVCFESGTMHVSGTPVICDNTRGGKRNSATGLFEKGTSGSVSDVSLFDSNKITVLGALEDDALIGIAMGTLSVQAVAQGSKSPSYTLTEYDAAKFFSADSGKTGNLDSINNRVVIGLDITRHPINVTANAGDTVSFTVSASVSNPKYQWQHKSPSDTSWADTTFSGSKTATLTVPAIAEYNGYQFRCKVTVVTSTVCSSAATLTVICPGHAYDDNVDGTCNNCGVKRETVEERVVVHMFRMYNPNTGEHFYTGSTVERDNLISHGWQYEGVGFTFPANTGDPVHRLFQPSTGEHLYTMDEAEKNRLMADGWNYEGIAFNSAYDTEAVQHRLHNPNATVGAYHFTFSEVEKQNLIDAGWEYQGIGWYSCWK